MTTHNDIAAALLVGTTFSHFSFGQDTFTLNFSRWSRQEAFGQLLPFEVVLEAQGDTQVHRPSTWKDLGPSNVDSAEALVAAGLVQLCQSGEDAVVSEVKVSGSNLELLFAGGSRVVVYARRGAMGLDWVVKDNPPGLPPTITWSVFCEGGAVGSKRP